MRQAGRYMAAYRKLREKYSFEQLCLIPELAAEVTLQPIQAFDVDAAILFSDILFPLTLFGVELSFDPKPVLVSQPWLTLQPPRDITSALQERLSGIYEATQMLSTQLDRPLIGFAGAPWTLAAFLIEGGASQNWERAQQAIRYQPTLFRALLLGLEEIVIAHLTLQIQAGCHAVQLFDSLSHLVPDEHLHDLVIGPLQRICQRIPPCPFIYYKASKRFLKDCLQNRPAFGLSLDETVDITSIRSSIPPSIALQGNLDPALLLSPTLPDAVRRIRESLSNDPGFIFNLSQGIPPSTPESIIHTLVQLLRKPL